MQSDSHTKDAHGTVMDIKNDSAGEEPGDDTGYHALNPYFDRDIPLKLGEDSMVPLFYVLRQLQDIKHQVLPCKDCRLPEQKAGTGRRAHAPSSEIGRVRRDVLHLPGRIHGASTPQRPDCAAETREKTRGSLWRIPGEIAVIFWLDQ